jgi:ATP-binding cassette subfamily C (CFTR/MRP) protein 1
MNISRTLLNPKKVVLIDEATASIDFESDERVQRVIKEKLKGSTIVTIAHRIDTILTSDRIVVLDAGRVVEMDSPHALLGRPSIFADLYREYQNKKVAA